MVYAPVQIPLKQIAGKACAVLHSVSQWQLKIQHLGRESKPDASSRQIVILQQNLV